MQIGDEKMYFTTLYFDDFTYLFTRERSTQYDSGFKPPNATNCVT